MANHPLTDILARPKQDGYELHNRQGHKLGRCPTHGGFAWKGHETALHLYCPLCVADGKLIGLWTTTHRLQAGFRVLTQDDLNTTADGATAIAQRIRTSLGYENQP